MSVAVQCNHARLTYSPDTTELLSWTGFKDDNVESMTDTVRCRSYTSQTSANDGYPRSLEFLARRWRVWSYELCNHPLVELEEQQDWIRDWIGHLDG